MTIQQHASFDSSAAELNATSKLVKAWESKNAKNAAKAGGISLMALSLAACGGSSTTTAVVDTTPVITQAELDAQTAAAEAAAAAQAVAEAAQAAAEAAQAAAEAALDAANNPTPVSLAMTTSTDILLGTASNDTFTGTTATYASTDVVSDASTSDADTLTFTASDDDDLDGSIVNIETVNVNLDAFTTTATATIFNMSVAGVSAGTTLNFDSVKAGSSVTGVTVSDMDSVTVNVSSAFTAIVV